MVISRGQSLARLRRIKPLKRKLNLVHNNFEIRIQTSEMVDVLSGIGSDRNRLRAVSLLLEN